MWFFVLMLPALILSPAFAPGFVLHDHDDDASLHLHQLDTRLHAKVDLAGWHGALHSPSSPSDIAGSVVAEVEAASWRNGVFLIVSNFVSTHVRVTTPIAKPLLSYLPPVLLRAAVGFITAPTAHGSDLANEWAPARAARSHVAGILQSNHSLLF
jgi:hypothetical protein